MTESGDNAPHPEDYCERCGRPNICWFVDSDRWNLAVAALPLEHRQSNRGLILCPSCFVLAHEQATDMHSAWTVVPTTPFKWNTASRKRLDVNDPEIWRHGGSYVRKPMPSGDVLADRLEPVSVDEAPDEWHSDFGDVIRSTLSKIGMTQDELAQRHGVTPGAVSQILNGNPTSSTVHKISEAIGVRLTLVASVDDIIYRWTKDEV